MSMVFLVLSDVFWHRASKWFVRNQEEKANYWKIMIVRKCDMFDMHVKAALPIANLCTNILCLHLFHSLIGTRYPSVRKNDIHIRLNPCTVRPWLVDSSALTKNSSNCWAPTTAVLTSGVAKILNCRSRYCISVFSLHTV